MDEFRENLWAPWRMEYIQSLAGMKSHGPDAARGCFLCDYRDRPEEDGAHHVLWRTADAPDRCGMMVVMNRFPYTNGHLLIAPLRHKPELDDFSQEELSDLMRHTRDAKRLLGRVVGAQGFNIGINFGLCAGAGLPDHLHIHLVPRWNGDTNFMAVIGDVRVIPESLDRQYEKLREAAAEMGLPE
jgi:ATP adenylyltransferase